MPDDRPEFKPGVPQRPPRVDFEVPVRYRPVGEERWYSGSTENLSRTGVLIRVAHLLPTETRVELILTLPAGVLSDLGGDMSCTGVVTRVIPASISGGSLGIAFETIRATEDTTEAK